MEELATFGLIILVILGLIIGAIGIINIVGYIVDFPDTIDYCQNYAFEHGYDYSYYEDGKWNMDSFCVRGAVFDEPEVYPLNWVKENCNSGGECGDG